MYKKPNWAFWVLQNSWVGSLQQNQLGTTLEVN